MKRRHRKRDVVSLGWLAEHFGFTKRWIDRLAKEKGFPRISRGHYDLLKCSRWLVDYYRLMAENARKESQSLQRSEERKAQYQADMLEIKLARERGEVITVDDAVDAIEPVLSSIRSIILGIPKHAARELGSKEVEQFLDSFVRKCLTELSSATDRLERPGHPEPAPPGEPENPQTPAEAESERVGRRSPDAIPGGKRRKRPVGNVQG